MKLDDAWFDPASPLLPRQKNANSIRYTRDTGSREDVSLAANLRGDITLAELPPEQCLEQAEFLNLFPHRGPHLMWLLGAGCSVAAGLPSAGTLTWEFKRRLYCNAEKIPITRFPDLYDRAFQDLVQSYFAAKGGYPPAGDDQEYSAYFEAYLREERDRRRFLDDRLQGCKPSYGHLCLAALMTLNLVRIGWTTNFDQLIEKACAHPQIAEHLPRSLGVAGLECPDKASDLLRDEAWPLLIKLHGDFQYRKLKNTTPELQSQDETLRQHLTEECARRGLAVVGYSGRDASVMGTLRAALEQKNPFPHGLFWFVRAGEPLLPAVVTLLKEAAGKRVQAMVVQITTFDELMADLFLPHQDSRPDVRDIVKAARPRRQPMPLSYEHSTAWPVLRTNGLHLRDYPASCTVFQATIDTTKEIKELTLPYASEMVARRRKKGIIAFGTRARLAEVFAKYEPTGFDRYVIEERRLCYECAELSLLYHASIQGLANKTGLQRSLNGKGRYLFAPDAKSFNPAEMKALAAVRSKGVSRPRLGLCLHEAIEISLDFRLGRFWMLIEPTIVATADGKMPYQGRDRSDVVREALVTRYNWQTNELLNMWLGFLQRHCGSPLTIAFPSEAQPEATFKVSVTTAYARKA